MSYEKISFETKDKVKYLGFGFNCDKAMTVLDEQTLKELDNAINEVQKEQSSLNGLVIFSHKDRCFLAGADINLISAMNTEAEGAAGAEAGQQIFNKIEDLKIPVVACVHGVCLGGGMELSLSCDVILASDDKATAMGLPEVKLGLIPGFGGTYRMPKRVGLPTALDLILSGRTFNSKKAKKAELVDAVYPRERLLEMAVKLHLKKSHKSKSFKDHLEDIAADNFLSRKIIFQKARENVLKKTKGFYQAPLKIIEVMESGMLKGRTSYLSSEATAFGQLCISEQSKNLQHIFFMTEQAKKFPGEATGKAKKLNRGAVLGAGTMGGGIAWLMSNSNMNPIMKDLTEQALVLGFKQASSNFMGAVKRRKMTPDDFERKMRSIRGQLDYHGFERTDLVIEAVVENLDIKKKVFAETEKHVSENCILTSNTSSLSVTAMAEALEKPERFAGLHFFNPVHRMPLVEIITHDKASNETLESLYNWVIQTKKTPVVVKDGPGFLVNRILMPFMNEAGFLLEEGVSVEDIDNACLNFGMPMGPCRLMDEVGHDVGVKVAHIIHEGVGDRLKSCDFLKFMVDKNFLGRKTGKGFYNYDVAGKVTGENEEAKAMLPSKSKKMDEVDIQMRVFLPMINEAAAILDEEIVKDAYSVDLGLIFGIGFPPFRGGLLRYADSEGLERILDALKRYQSEVDEDRYRPTAYLEKLVENKKKFYDI